MAGQSDRWSAVKRDMAGVDCGAGVMDEDEEEYGCEYCRNDMPLNDNDCCPKCDAWYPRDDEDRL